MSTISTCCKIGYILRIIEKKNSNLESKHTHTKILFRQEKKAIKTNNLFMNMSLYSQNMKKLVG